MIFVAAVLIVAMVVTRIGTIAVRRLQRRMEAAQSAKQELALQRASTVAHTLSYVVRVVVWTIAALTILGRANIQLGPLIAGAGVVGVALGFGAQSVVRDYLAGVLPADRGSARRRRRRRHLRRRRPADRHRHGADPADDVAA
ncbi:MAG TPA: hypothetical protein VF902_10675, partial [Coriobacteriia bacterium]